VSIRDGALLGQAVIDHSVTVVITIVADLRGALVDVCRCFVAIDEHTVSAGAGSISVDIETAFTARWHTGQSERRAYAVGGLGTGELCGTPAVRLAGEKAHGIVRDDSAEVAPIRALRCSARAWRAEPTRRRDAPVGNVAELVLGAQLVARSIRADTVVAPLGGALVLVPAILDSRAFTDGVGVILDVPVAFEIAVRLTVTLVVEIPIDVRVAVGVAIGVTVACRAGVEIVLQDRTHGAGREKEQRKDADERKANRTAIQHRFAFSNSCGS